MPLHMSSLLSHSHISKIKMTYSANTHLCNLPLYMTYKILVFTEFTTFLRIKMTYIKGSRASRMSKMCRKQPR